MCTEYLVSSTNETRVPALYEVASGNHHFVPVGEGGEDASDDCESVRFRLLTGTMNWKHPPVLIQTMPVIELKLFPRTWSSPHCIRVFCAVHSTWNANKSCLVDHLEYLWQGLVCE